MSDSPHSTDVVVIGAGHNGLTTACYLADAGLSVTVVEAGGHVGGMTSTVQPFADAPDHWVNTCAVDMVFLNASTVVKDLRLDEFGFRQVEPDAPYAYVHPDGSTLAIRRSITRTAEDIARFSRRDAERYVQLMETLVAGLQMALPLMSQNITKPSAKSLTQTGAAVLRNLRHVSPFGKVVAEAGLATVLENFESPVVQAALAGLVGFVNPLDEDASGANMFMAAGVHHLGVTRPVGGTGALPRALTQRLESRGGRVITSWPVEEILISGGVAVGVRGPDGAQIHARRGVVAACDPKRTLLELVPDGQLDRVSQIRAEQIPANDFGVGPFKIDIALSGRLQLRHEHPAADMRQSTILWGTFDQVREAFDVGRTGRVPDAIPMITAVPNEVDPTQSPAGQDSLYIYSGAVPVNPPGGWDEALIQKTTDRILDQVRQVYVGLDDLEISRRVMTPDDYRSYSTNGSILHVDTGLFRMMGPARPAPGMAGYRSPITKLWLTGIGTHPGGGVSGLSGRNAALAMLKTFNG